MEYSPGPFQRMTPAGIPGILAVLLVVFGAAGLYGMPGFLGLGAIIAISIGLAVLLGKWHVRHPTDSKPLHLDSVESGPAGNNR